MSEKFNSYNITDSIRNNLSNFFISNNYSNNKELRDILKEKWGNPDPKEGGVLSKPLIEANFNYETADENLVSLSKKYPELQNFVEHLRELENLKKEDISTMFSKNHKLQEKFYRLIKSNIFPIERNLYKHQVNSIEYCLKDKKDLIISSGTGSGKSECFLIPILAKLFSESDKELEQDGIRVLIVYPLNALINSQMKRLQTFLGYQNSKRPYIRFGFYTSKLKDDTKNRYDTYSQERNPECYFPITQIIDRKELRESPPHILITNYSMLEYSLLRARDLPLFNSNKLHTVILDEAHTYTGALAAEMAMLLRRTLFKFNKNQDEVNFFATSATIGDPEKDNGKKLEEFASKLYSKNSDNVKAVLGKKKLDKIKIKNSKLKLIFSSESIINSPIISKKMEIWKNDYNNQISYHIGKPNNKEIAVLKKANDEYLYLVNHYDIESNFMEDPKKLASKKLIKYLSNLEPQYSDLGHLNIDNINTKFSNTKIKKIEQDEQSVI